MKNEDLIKRIKQKAKQDTMYRRDRRFLNAMGFFVAKGFLRTNLNVLPTPNRRLKIADVIWAGEYVEPRILEVLPAAVLRLQKHFDFEPQKYPELNQVIQQLRTGQKFGEKFHGIPFEKIAVWANFPLRDGRIKTLNEKKVTKTFRLQPQTLEKLKALSEKHHCTETEILERLIEVRS